MVDNAVPRNEDHTAEENSVGAVRQFTAFAITLLICDAISKVLITQFFGSLDPQLGIDWNFSSLVQGAGIFFVLMIFLWFFRPKLSDFNCVFIFIAVSVILSFVANDFQDFTNDGTWYHFLRVTMFSLGEPLSNATATIIVTPPGDPSVFYPLLSDNLRGLVISTLGTGPFSAISINFGCLASALYFWDRYASFLPRLLRWIPAVSPIAAAQLVTYYGDGWVATIGVMGLLVSILLAAQWARPASLASTASVAVATLFLVVFALVLAQLKLSFPALLIEYTLPLWLALAVGVAASVRGKSTPLAKLPGMFGAQLLRRDGVVAGLSCAAGAMALANPYFLYAKSFLTAVPYPFFTPAFLKFWTDFALVGQVRPLFGTIPSIFHFYYANMMSIWPGGSRALLEPQVHGVSDVARNLFVRAGLFDAQFSGFGPFSALVLFYALWRCAAGFPAIRAEISAGQWSIGSMVAVTFLAELLLASIVPLAWWARMNPAIYSVAVLATVLQFAAVYRRISARGQSPFANAGVLASALCLLIIIPTMVLPAVVLTMRSSYKMTIVRDVGRPLAQIVANRPGRTLTMPNNCPGRQFQASLASKFVSAFPEQRLRARFRDDNLCETRTLELIPGVPFCYCGS